MTVANLITAPLNEIQLSPGSHVLISGVSWEQYEALYAAWGEERQIPRMNYCNGTLELMSPLPAHERPHRIIGYIVTTILDVQERDWEDFGSTTFKKLWQAGLEPDTCFYIANAERVREKQRLDMTTDPSPDLAMTYGRSETIEADVTSKTTLEAYAALRVPEVWIYDAGKLNIYGFQEDQYIAQSESPTFPELPIAVMIPQVVEQAFYQGSSKMLRALRKHF